MQKNHNATAAAWIFGLPRKTVSQWVRDGTIEARRVGKRTYIDMPSLRKKVDSLPPTSKLFRSVRFAPLKVRIVFPFYDL